MKGYNIGGGGGEIKFLIVDGAAADGDSGWMEVCCKLSPVGAQDLTIGHPKDAMDTVF